MQTEPKRIIGVGGSLERGLRLSHRTTFLTVCTHISTGSASVLSCGIVAYVQTSPLPQREGGRLYTG